MSDYDRWLEKPYVDAAEREAEFERFCEKEGLEFDDPSAEEAFERHIESMEEAE